MTTSTKPKIKTAPPTKAAAAAKRIADEQRELLEAEDAIYYRLAVGDEPTADDDAIFAVLDRSADHVERQVGRQRARIKWDLIAGTKSSRVVSKQSAETSQENLRTDGPPLEAEITRLQKQLDELNLDATTKHQQVEAETNAVAGLRKCIPPHVVATIDKSTARVNKRYARQIGELESRLKMIEQVTAMTWNGSGKMHDNAVLHARTHAPNLVREDKIRGPAIRDKMWPGYCEKLNAERAGLIDQLAPLKEKLAAELKQIEVMRDVYIR